MTQEEIIKEYFIAHPNRDIKHPEVVDSCRFPYEVNNKSKFFLSDVTKITKKEINLLLDGADIKIIAGCAPCQPF